MYWAGMAYVGPGGRVKQPEDRMVAQAWGFIAAFVLTCIAGLIAME
jgi:hypothetical protein